jgi:hypothetical protein
MAPHTRSLPRPVVNVYQAVRWSSLHRFGKARTLQRSRKRSWVIVAGNGRAPSHPEGRHGEVMCAWIPGSPMPGVYSNNPEEELRSGSGDGAWAPIII